MGATDTRRMGWLTIQSAHELIAECGYCGCLIAGKGDAAEKHMVPHHLVYDPPPPTLPFGERS